MKQHHYLSTLEWTGNQGTGTSGYTAYTRDYSITGPEKNHSILGSSDPSFRGDPTRFNPEDILIGSLTACHMLWYLHLCSVNKIIVTAYRDDAKGIMDMKPDGTGKFQSVTLYPTVTITDAAMTEKAMNLHHQASKLCNIANSVNFEIGHEATILIS